MSRSNKKVWWLGSQCGHEWEALISNRTGKGNASCPYCSNHKTLKGFNDMWTTNPEMAKQLLNPEIGHKYMQRSNKKADWKCSQCETVIKNRTINSVYYKGLSCPICSDGISFGEKFVCNILEENNIEYEFDTAQAWSKGRRYDFYFELNNRLYIIEVHGLQHYEEGFATLIKGDTLSEVQENDKLKEKLARKNGVDNYIVIDARKSTVEWMKENVLSSDIMKIVDSIDFMKVGQLSHKSLVKEACDLWNSGLRNTTQIAEKLRLDRSTIVNYLKRGVKAGWCDYCPKEASRLSGTSKNSIQKSIVQLENNSAYVKYWSSIREVGGFTGMSREKISSSCKGRRKTVGGFKWMYKEDYDKMIQEGLTHEEYMNKYYPKTK